MLILKRAHFLNFVQRNWIVCCYEHALRRCLEPLEKLQKDEKALIFGAKKRSADILKSKGQSFLLSRFRPYLEVGNRKAND